MKSDHSRSSPSFGGLRVEPQDGRKFERVPGTEPVSVPRHVQEWAAYERRSFEANRPRLRLVIVESPFAGNVPRNIAYAKRAVNDCLQRGEAPIASHLLFTQPGVLDDTVPGERALGIEAGLAWYRAAEACVVYQDFGFSEGMGLGIRRAEAFGVPVEFRNIGTDGSGAVPGVYSEDQGKGD